VSTRRKSPSAKKTTLVRGPNNRFLCRRCSIEVPIGRRTFCSDDCVHEWKLRTNPSYVRKQLKKRDKGICALCNLDTLALAKRLRALKKIDKLAWKEKLSKLKIPAYRNSYFDADHIVPVIQGGGECGLENYRTLCLWCHKQETAKLRSKL